MVFSLRDIALLTEDPHCLGPFAAAQQLFLQDWSSWWCWYPSLPNADSLVRPDLGYCPHPYNYLAPGFPRYAGWTDVIEHWILSSPFNLLFSFWRSWIALYDLDSSPDFWYLGSWPCLKSSFHDGDIVLLHWWDCMLVTASGPTSTLLDSGTRDLRGEILGIWNCLCCSSSREKG